MSTLVRKSRLWARLGLFRVRVGVVDRRLGTILWSTQPYRIDDLWMLESNQWWWYSLEWAHVVCIELSIDRIVFFCPQTGFDTERSLKSGTSSMIDYFKDRVSVWLEWTEVNKDAPPASPCISSTILYLKLNHSATRSSGLQRPPRPTKRQHRCSHADFTNTVQCGRSSSERLYRQVWQLVDKKSPGEVSLIVKTACLRQHRILMRPHGQTISSRWLH